MVWVLPPVTVTVNTAFVVPVLPSVTVTSPMFRVGRPSSLMIVQVACARATVAFTGPDRFRTNVSFGSRTVSPITGTLTATLVVPAGNVAGSPDGSDPGSGVA